MPFPKNFTDDRAFYARVRRGEKALPPLRTITEMAEEFGLTSHQLAGLMCRSELNPPQPRIKSHGRRVTNTYYNPAEVRAWWKRHNEK